MSASRPFVFITAASAVVLSLAAGPAIAQGNSGAHAKGPKTAAPVQAGKPAVPPGQAKTPPAAAASGPKVKVAGPIVVKPSLAANLQPLLPIGTTVDAAAMGFKNLGQFVAAVHVSRNLDIPFSSLRTEMVTNNHSLGQSIQILKPSVDAGVEATRADKAAKLDIEKFGK